MKTLEIEIPEGHEIDQDKSTFEKIVFKEVEKVVTCWEDLQIVGGHYVDDCSGIDTCDHEQTASGNRNIFKTKPQARASIAIAQLTQLMADVNGDWVPDWEDSTTKFCFKVYETELTISRYISYAQFLAFETTEIRLTFLTNHEDLIKQAAPILWGVEL